MQVTQTMGAIAFFAATAVAVHAASERSDLRTVPSRVNTSNGTNTTITAGRLSFDYKRSIAEFTNSVVVTDPQIRILSDNLIVRFDKDNNVESAIASGNVRISQEDRTATCSKAVYSLTAGNVMLTGDAEIRRKKDVLRGEEITFWLNDDKITCQSGQLVIFPEEGKASAMSPRLKAR